MGQLIDTSIFDFFDAGTNEKETSFIQCGLLVFGRFSRLSISLKKKIDMNDGQVNLFVLFYKTKALKHKNFVASYVNRWSCYLR